MSWSGSSNGRCCVSSFDDENVRAFTISLLSEEEDENISDHDKKYEIDPPGLIDNVNMWWAGPEFWWPNNIVKMINKMT